MFNREYRDMGFIPRWTIVRKLRTQYLAEHSYLVAMYANDICSFLGLEDHIWCSVLQYALWHDIEETFSGDFPGPAKRALVEDRDAWKAKVKVWMRGVFGMWPIRAGRAGTARGTQLVEAIVKCADWLSAACEMATERQLGNDHNCRVHMEHCMANAYLTAGLVCSLLGRPDDTERLRNVITLCIMKAWKGLSEGPLVDPAERDIAERDGLVGPSPYHTSA